jgi:hypothetical protein
LSAARSARVPDSEYVEAGIDSISVTAHSPAAAKQRVAAAEAAIVSDARLVEAA